MQEHILELAAEGVSESLPSGLPWVCTAAHAKHAQGLDGLRAEDVWSHRHPLAELLEGHATDLECPDQVAQTRSVQPIASCEQGSQPHDSIRNPDHEKKASSPDAEHNLPIPWLAVVGVHPIQFWGLTKTG